MLIAISEAWRVRMTWSFSMPKMKRSGVRRRRGAAPREEEREGSLEMTAAPTTVVPAGSVIELGNPDGPIRQHGAQSNDTRSVEVTVPDGSGGEETCSLTFDNTVTGKGSGRAGQLPHRQHLTCSSGAPRTSTTPGTTPVCRPTSNGPPLPVSWSPCEGAPDCPWRRPPPGPPDVQGGRDELDQTGSRPARKVESCLVVPR